MLSKSAEKHEVVIFSIFNDFYLSIMLSMFDSLKIKVEEIISDAHSNPTEKMQLVCKVLKENIDYYDWVGFYFKNGDKRELKLGPYAGAPTDHTIIPFGKGICGQVAESNQNFVVPDVHAQDNYIACSLTVRSEIVIPLFKNGENIGQIDIDSDTPDPFSTEDERFLEWVNERVAGIL